MTWDTATLVDVVFVLLLLWLSYTVHDLERRLARLEEKLNGAQMLERLHAVEKRIYPKHD